MKTDRIALSAGLIVALAAVLAWPAAAPRAENDSGSFGQSITQAPLTVEQFQQSPASLLNDPAAVGSNAANLLQMGVPSGQIANVLSAGAAGTTGLVAGVGSTATTALNQTQWASVLTNLQNNMSSLQSGVGNIQNTVTSLQNGVSPAAAATLINGAFGGAVSPQVTQALSLANNLGNMTSLSSLTNLLGGSNITSALSSLSALGQGQAVDQILLTALGGNSNLASQLLAGTNLSQLAGTIAKIAPNLASQLGLSGIQNALGGAVNSIVSGATGNILGAVGSVFGGGALGLGGASSIASGAGSVGAVATSLTSSLSACGPPTGCCIQCDTAIPQHHLRIRTEMSKSNIRIRNEVTDDFVKHRGWMLTTFWTQNLMPALGLMAEQLTVTGMAQVQMFGQFLDAKHQLETQRLFQELTARAHKDYQPSEGMCTFGTNVRSLAPSERRSNLTQLAFSQRMLQRETLNGDALSNQGPASDLNSRLQNFVANYCDQADNANGLAKVCPNSVPDAARRDIDVDYTRNIESKLTLDIDFTDTGKARTSDEKDVFALSANLFSDQVAPRINPDTLAQSDGKILQSGVERLMDLRAVVAKRSVAQNSFAAIAALRASGSAESAPYTKAIMRELGVSNDDEINKMLGDKPSYFAQMEVLTKKLYQNPIFYTELYDKPANIQRKGAALQAIGLMQDRDLYNSLIRSEAVLSVLLETELKYEEDRVQNNRGNITQTGSGAAAP